MSGTFGRVLTTGLALGIVAAAATAGTGGIVPAGQVGPQGSGQVRHQGLPVDLAAAPTTLVCPPAPASADSTSTDPGFERTPVDVVTSVTAVGAGLPDGTAPALRGRSLPRATQGSPQIGSELPATGSANVSLLRGDGSLASVVELAAGDVSPLAALALTRTDAGDLAGLAASSCTAPAASSWLVGGAVEPGRSGRIILSNPGQSTVTADLRVLTAQGASSPPAAQALVVAAGSTREVLLEGLVGDQPAVAVEVQASGGALAAALVETDLDGVEPQGVEHVQATAAATRSVIPGVLTGAGATLRLANPSEEPVVVGWQLLGRDGAPGAGTATDPGSGTGAVATVGAGAVLDIALEALATGPDDRVPAPVAVVVTSEVPVLAAVQLTVPREGAAERAWVPPAPAVPGEALVVLGPAGVRSHLSMAAGDGGAQVSLRGTGVDGAPLGQESTFDVDAGSVLTTVLPVDAVAVRVTVTSGTLHAAQVLTAEPADGLLNSLVSVVPVQVPPGSQRRLVVGALAQDSLRRQAPAGGAATQSLP